MAQYDNRVRDENLLRATRALLKFWREHDYPEYGRKKLSACVSALEANDFPTALGHFQAIPFGTKDYFGDWFPPAASDTEADKYQWEILNALTDRACLRWRAAADDQRVLKRFLHIPTACGCGGCAGLILGGLFLYLTGIAAAATYVLLEAPANMSNAALVSAVGISIAVWLLRS